MVHVAPVDVSHAAVVKFLYETDVEIANALALELVSADFSAAMVEGLIRGKFSFFYYLLKSRHLSFFSFLNY